MHGSEGAACAMDQSGFGAFDLSLAQSPSQLTDGFDDQEDASHAGMIRRHAAPIGVDGEGAAEADSSVFHESASLSQFAEAQVLKRDEQGDGEGVVEGAEVDVRRFHARHLEGILARLAGSDVQEVWSPRALMSDGFPAAAQDHGRLGEIPGFFKTRDDHGSPPSLMMQQSSR